VKKNYDVKGKDGKKERIYQISKYGMNEIKGR
jgi:hypothetical protein